MATFSQMFGGTNSHSTPRYTQMQIQTSAQGLPVPLGWGTFRVSPNLIWYGDFQSKQVNQGGKGGGKGGSQYTYSAAVAMGLGEGPLTDMHTLFPSLYPNSPTWIGRIWRDQAQTTTLAKLNLTPFPGTVGQSAWTTPPALQQIAYSALAYVASPKYGLGSSPALPNHSFELFRAYAGAYTAQLEAFTPGQLPAKMGGGDVYTASGFGAQPFTYINTWNGQLMFSPPVGSAGAGTLSLVSGVGPAAIAYSAAAVTNVPVLDANPADVIEDFLTNPQYSVRLPSSSIDPATLAFYRTYCAAQGIFLSPVLDSQEQVSQIIDRWASLTNTLIFFSEGLLKFVPLGDSAITNTAITPNVSFTPNLTIAYDLTFDDFIDTGKQGANGDPAPPVTVTRVDPADAPNHVKIEIKDRANSYNTEPVEWQDQGLVDQFGQIDAPVTQAHEVCDLTIGTVVAQLVGQRLAYQRNTYAFTLGAEFSLLEPGDILTLSDPHIGLVKQPVRIKTIDEDDKLQLAVVAEEFPGTLGTAVVGTVQAGAGGGGGIDKYADPGNVNPPAIFEPSSALTNGQAQIWIALSGGANWGSAAVTASFDGVNYATVGYVGLASPQGVLTAGLANFGGTNPDLADTLSVDLTESLQTLPTDATQGDAQAGRTLSLLQSAFVVSGGSATVPNSGELLAYGAVVQGAGQYASTLGYLYRGDYGLGPAAFATGDFFTRIEVGEIGPPLNAVLTYNVPAQYIGKTVYFKFLSINVFGNEMQDPSAVVEYAYTITGRGYGGGTGGVPQQPTGVTATGIIGGIAVGWSANPPTDNVKSYTAYRDGTNVYSGNTTGWTDTGVVPGVSHTYTVSATNAAGTSAASAGATAAALNQVQGGRSIAVSTGSVTLLPTDSYVGITNASGGAITINLPASPATNQTIQLADEGNNAGTFGWTIKNSGAATVGTVVSNSGGVSLHWTGSIWQQVF